MKSAERQEVSQALFEFAARLRALKTPLPCIPPWPFMVEGIEEAYRLFEQGVDALVLTIEKCANSLKSDRVGYGAWRKRVRGLGKKVDQVRDCKNVLFNRDFESLVYNYIFACELLGCVPDGLFSHTQKYLVLPTGDHDVWSVNKHVAMFAPLWVEPPDLHNFVQIGKENSLIAFEYSPEELFEHQTVLTHEIFHATAMLSGELAKLLNSFCKNKDFADVLGDDKGNLEYSHVEELFCDYAAVWAFGPVCIEAFCHEISLDAGETSSTHPKGDLRAKFLLSCYRMYKRHPAHKALMKYLKLSGGNGLPFEESMEVIGGHFREALKKFKVPQFRPKNRREEVKLFFDNNIPFVEDDVRVLLNNLPKPKEIRKPEKYFDLTSESLRKIHILRQVKPHLREGDALFAFPKGLS